LRKTRKIEREIGPIRFELHTGDRSVLRQLLKWKSEQYRNTGVADVFSFHWTTALVENILARQEREFCGVLSAMFAGDRLVAAHFGMRSARVLHWWFPSYDGEFSQYSPGLILLVELIKSAAAEGVTRLDLGKGSERYKAAFQSGGIDLAEGCFDVRPLTRVLRRGWRAARRRIQNSKLRRPVSMALHMLAPVSDWLAFH
jgi:CelD/BcsL family acetyltransferase involved in cellulose biosynthesis